ncbi:DUF2332 family protein [uncultured Roseobacter sp.]|uniref:DUF2332 domain-containing protein n=1 Tax=uncultured Roseobacter sp. TaxID=114847 RepID=UPI00263A2B4C|nr:DUF2332 family protein [uncultured Roseobacter sp.]
MTLTEAFHNQARSCEKLGSPFMEQLLRLLGDHWPVERALAARFEQFTGDIGPGGASLPLRMAGGLHALVLSQRAPGLARLYPPFQVSDAALLESIVEAMRIHEAFLLDWVESPPQTNEVRRSAALIAAAGVVATRYDLPFVLSELGASAGLNLMWDRFALSLPGLEISPDMPALTLSPEWQGPLPPNARPDIAARAGVDLNPLDPSDPDDLLRLRAYLWPDQPHRLELTRAAAAICDAPVTRGDAIDWLATRLTSIPDGHVHLIQHTVAWQYFPQEAQSRGQKLIEQAGAEATAQSPLAWLAMENDGDSTGALGAALTLRLWPEDEAIQLGRADFHGRWVHWA